MRVETFLFHLAFSIAFVRALEMTKAGPLRGLRRKQRVRIWELAAREAAAEAVSEYVDRGACPSPFS